jgi:putative ABC transport system permease protein
MYTAVLERTKEIGLMKAIGATNNTIMLIFLIESGLLGLVGGLIGVLFGLGLAYLTAYIGKTVLDTLLLNAWFSWWLVFGALAFAFIVGVCSGVLPARQASKQKPVDSLRYE